MLIELEMILKFVTDSKVAIQFGSLESTKRTFTYSDLLKFTNNFETVLGKGGFGTVYLGYIEKSQVAIKMLSSSSIQGFQQFQAEARWSKQIDLTFFSLIISHIVY